MRSFLRAMWDYQRVSFLRFNELLRYVQKTVKFIETNLTARGQDCSKKAVDVLTFEWYHLANWPLCMKTSSHTSTFRSENHHKSPVGKVTNRKIQRQTTFSFHHKPSMSIRIRPVPFLTWRPRAVACRLWPPNVAPSGCHPQRKCPAKWLGLRGATNSVDHSRMILNQSYYYRHGIYN